MPKNALEKNFKLIYLSLSIAEWPRFGAVSHKLAFFTDFPLILIERLCSGKLWRINRFFFKRLHSKKSGEANQ